MVVQPDVPSDARIEECREHLRRLATELTDHDFEAELGANRTGVPLLVRLVWVFATEPAQVAAVRAVVREALPGECARRDDVEMVAGELAANAARHSRGDKFGIRLSLSSSLVELMVHDAGGDTAPTLTEPPDPLAALDADPEDFEHGRGLRLVEAYSDGWGHSADENGCATWARFHLPSEAGPSAVPDGAEVSGDRVTTDKHGGTVRRRTPGASPESASGLGPYADGEVTLAWAGLGSSGGGRRMRTSFLELELTNRCQLECAHCYAASGPDGTHGTMTATDWRRVIDQAVDAGVGTIQFIGGEPTLHADLSALLDHALTVGIEVEVFSNLVHVKPELWETFSRPGVRLATSWYSDDAGEHTAITNRPTHASTRANIAEAVRRGIPLRVGVIDMLNGQRVDQARAELEAMGVANVTTDRIRGVGRGARSAGNPSVSELCGHCGDGQAAISPNGDVSPCVLSRWMTAGNVKEQPLADILGGPTMRSLVEAIPAPRGSACKPDSDGGDCAPAETPTCLPSF